MGSCGIKVMKFYGGSWVNISCTGFNPGGAAFSTITTDNSGTPYVACMDYNYSGRATVIKYNGSNWVRLGSSGFSPGKALYTSIAIDGSGVTYIAYKDAANSNKASVMKFSPGAVVENISDSMAALVVFPNPNKGVFSLRISSVINEEATIIITDVLGRKVAELTMLTNADKKVELNNPAGFYYILAVAQSTRQVVKVLVE